MADSEYVLGRDYRASARLNYQHWLLRSQLGFLLAPQISGLDATSLRIADIGAGTCLWLADVADTLPGAELHGFDISLAQAPPKEWLPKAVTCHTHDAFKPFPNQWHGYFDVVHVRLFLCVIKDADPSLLLQNLRSLLRPGGYLQWVDGNPSSAEITTVSPDTPRSATEALLAFETKPRSGSNFSWTSELANSLIRAGFENVSDNRYPIGREQFHYWNMCHLMLYEEYAARTLADDNTDAASKEVARSHLASVDRVYVEFKKGASINADFICVVGQVGVHQD